MITTSIPPVVPAAFSEFKDMFHKLEQPYKRDDVVRFNLLYQQVYPSLSPTEKQNAEILADELIQGLEHENPGPSIYGITDL